MRNSIQWIGVFLSATCASCSDSSYTTQNPQPKTPKRTTAVAAEGAKSENSTPIRTQVKSSPESASPSLPVSPTNPVCSIEASSLIEASVPTHQDLDAELTNRYGRGFPTSDVAESSVVRFDLSKIQGTVLPVSSFSLDDIAIIVRESDSLASASTWDAASRTRKIIVPSHAIMIFDGNDPDYASGAVDSDATTVYSIHNKTIVLPGGQSRSLREVYGSGIPLIAHNKISLDELKSRGFVDSSGKIVFKIFHVAHGWGNVTLRFDVKKCASLK